MPISVCVCGMIPLDRGRLRASAFCHFWFHPTATHRVAGEDTAETRRSRVRRDGMNVGSREKERRGAHTFALRQPCVISARHHVAFQCIISAGKMPDMQNQILLRSGTLLRLVRVSPPPTSSSPFSPFAANPAVSLHLPFPPSVFLSFSSSPSVFLVSSSSDR